MSFAVTDPTPTAPVRTDAAWLDAHWMPYTGNRQFKANPRMIVEGSGAFSPDSEGRKNFDGLSGLLCAGLGHGRREIAEAKGIAQVVVDRGGFKFTGRIAAIVDAAVANGLSISDKPAKEAE